jgi:two-component system, cell cycle sensor histidine kinase and response regulator CckA
LTTSTRGQFEKPQAVLRAMLESPLGIVIFALDREYRYLAFNENHARTIKTIWGETVEVGVNMLDLIKREDDRRRAKENFDRVLAGENFTLNEAYGDEQLERRYYEDAYSPIRDEDGAVIGLTVYLTDITDRRRAELELQSYRTRLEELVERRTAELESAHAQLLHVQKLESLGVLAGGVAHDFNNLLAVILGRAELASAQLPFDSAARAHLAIVQETALEARMLTKQLLGYSGKGKFMVQLVDLNQLVESMMQLLRASISRSIPLHFERAAAPQLVDADLTQLRQVVLNLVTNAAEAIGDGGGTVTIRTRTFDVDQAYLNRTRAQPQVLPGRFVAIEVQDTGCGMDERVRSKLFDPFFTTKFAGRGLGLAAVLGIVSGHRGSIALTTAVGAGTTFAVLLPAVDPERELPRASLTPAAPLSVQRATVLVIDDENAVRSMTAVSLESAGHVVLSAGNGREGLELFRANRQRIELVLLDLTMPDMNGEQTLRALQGLDPNVAVLVMTGYAEDDVHERFQLDELAGFLAKPFARDELFGAVEAALRRARRHPR